MKILRNTLLLLAASSIAFTSCNKKEDEILEELDDLKTEMNATDYSSSGVSAEFSLTGKNSTTNNSYSSYTHSFVYNYINTAAYTDANSVDIHHFKGSEEVYSNTKEENVNLEYDFYAKYFTVSIVDNNQDLKDAEPNDLNYIQISFVVYEGDLPWSYGELGFETGTPQNISVSYDVSEELEDNDVWEDSDFRGAGIDYNDATEKYNLKEVFTISNYEYDDVSGAISFGLSGDFEYYDADAEDDAMAFEGTFTSNILKETFGKNHYSTVDYIDDYINNDYYSKAVNNSDTYNSANYYYY